MGAPAVARPRRRPARPKPKPGRSRARAHARRARPRPGQRRRCSSPVGQRCAVGGIADSGFVIGMARSRVWIGVLGVLLGGIVAINVVGLSLSASGSQTSAKIDELIRDNSVQQSRLAHRLSNGRISREATALGLAVPAARCRPLPEGGRRRRQARRQAPRRRLDHQRAAHDHALGERDGDRRRDDRPGRDDPDRRPRPRRRRPRDRRRVTTDPALAPTTTP